MAKKSQARTEKGLTREELNKIWTKIGDDRWLQILQKYKPTYGFVHSGGGILKGKCLNPDHADTAPSFFIFVNQGHAHCFGCQYHTANPIDLLEYILETTTSDVFSYLQDEYKISSLSKKAQAEFEMQRINLATKDAIYSACHTALCEALAQPNNADFEFARKALTWLLVDRDIPEDVIHCLPVGIMPPLTRLTEIITDLYTKRYSLWKSDPGRNPEPQNYAVQATQYLHDYCQVPYFAGSVVWPLHVTPKEIGRLKLRAPHNNTKKDIIIPEDPFEDLLGLYGLGWDQYRIFTEDPQLKPDFAYLTEGEIDVMSLMARFVQSGDIKYPIFSVGGTSASGHIEPILKMSGIKKVYLVGDAPHGKGNTVVQNWLNRINELEAKVFSGWDRLSPYKDIDEAVVKGGEPLVSTAIHLKFSETFSSAWEWACDQAASDISNIPANDLRNVILSASTHGRYLRNRLDCDLYVQSIAQRYDLNPDILKREIASREDSEDGFMLRIKDALSDLLYLVGTDKSQGKSLVLFNKRRPEYYKIQLNNPQAIFQELAPVIGPPCDFVRDYVGYPGFLPDPSISNNSLGHIQTDKAIRNYANISIMKWSKGAPSFDNSEILNQGYHYTTNAEGQHNEYIVSGMDVFKIARSAQGDTDYTLLDGPSDGSTIFNVNQKLQIAENWYPGGLSISLLNGAKNIDIRQYYQDLVTFFDVGFRFKHQRVVPQLLAALIMLFPIMDAFERPPLLFVTGDTNSGKSTLLSVFGNTGNLDPTGLRLLYGSDKYDNYSSAGIANDAAFSTLLRIFDEFEINHRNPRHAEAVRAIYELYRTLVNGLTTRIRKGQEGVDRIVLRHPIIFGAIAGADTTQDMNRLTIVEMKQIKGGFYPLHNINDHLGPEKLEALRRNTNIALFHHVPALVSNYQRVVKEYKAYAPSLPIPIDTRYVSAFFSTFTLMDHIGVDWRKFFYDWVMANEDVISRSTNIRESDSIFRDMLYATVIKQAERENPVCVAQLLATPDTKENINSASVGMFYERHSNLLLVLVPQAHPRFFNRPGQLPITTTRLKDILDRHSAALTPKEVTQSGIIPKAERFLGTGIRLHDVVVLRLSDVLRDSVSAPTDVSAAPSSTPAEMPEITPAKEATTDAPSADPSDYDFNVED